MDFCQLSGLWRVETNLKRKRAKNMDRNIFRKHMADAVKHLGKTGKLSLSLLLAAALSFGGCSNPVSDGNNGGGSNKTSANTTEEAEPPNSGGQASENSGSNSDGQAPESSNPNSDGHPSDGQSQGSSTPDGTFDFSQALDLKKTNPAAGELPRILFVGNSHTFSNDLPAIFSEVAAAMGRPSDVQELTEGYYTLTQYADNTDELGAALEQKLTGEHWDFVFLQENTNDAFAFAEENMLPAAAALDEKIRGAGGQTALLMTWTPKDGASIFTPEQVQAVLAQNLIQVSSQLNSLLVPGGVAFMRCMEQCPDIGLWAEDGMHPSLEGSYLAACLAYAVIFQETPVGCSYTADIDAGTAARLQEVAAGFLAQ